MKRRPFTQERAHLTHERLLRSAGEAFAASGFEGATLAGIAKNAGVTTGALYFSFAGKEALAHSVIQREIEIATATSHTALTREGEALESMLLLGHDWSNLIAGDPIVAAGVRLILERPDLVPEISSPYQHWVGTAEELLRRARENGELRVDADVTDIAFVFTSAFVGVDLLGRAVDARDKFRDHLNVMWRILFTGITDHDRAPRALQLLETGF